MSASSMSKMKQKPEDIFPAIKQFKDNAPKENEDRKTLRSFKQSKFGMLFQHAMESKDASKR